MSQDFSNVPFDLRERRQWVCWRYAARKGKQTKVPVNPRTGKNASSTNQKSWGSFDEALAGYERFECAGIGYVFAADDPFCGVDLDACRDPATGKLTPWAAKIVKALSTYTEVSPSEFGVKIFLRAKPQLGHSVKKLHGVETYGPKSPEIAVYGTGRFFCVTGQRYV